MSTGEPKTESTMLQDSYEYIVVGSGAGGGTVAAGLAEKGHTVLVLEAGGDDTPCTYSVPVLHGFATEDPEMRLDHFVRHYSDERRQERDSKYVRDREKGGVYYPRARTIGGCTAHYAMIIIRPHDSDWEAIRNATGGDESWAPKEMNKYFERVERCLYRSGGGHGANGWLPTQRLDVAGLAGQAFRHHDAQIASIAGAALIANNEYLKINLTGGAGAQFDPNDLGVLERREVGAILVPTAIDEFGRRAGTRERIGKAQQEAPKMGGRLDVRTHSHVTELVFDPADPVRVVGVRYLSGERLYRADRDSARLGQPKGTAREVRATREVILSAGAFITPQLLMLSGIGDAKVLDSFKIPVRIGLRGVGKNLQDRYEVGITATYRNDFRLLREATFKCKPGDPFYDDWLKDGKGLYATNGAVVGFLARSSVAEHGEPDLFIFGVPGSFGGYYTGWAEDSVAKKNKWTWLLLKAHTRFRGSVTLRSGDPLDPPVVNFNYFETDSNGELRPESMSDLTAMRDGVERIKKLCSATGAKPDEPLYSREQIHEFVQANAWGHHASCTCPIGPKESDGVLTTDFRVHGTKGLRVVDASVFPKIPGFFVVMPIYMIAEKAVDVIHADSKTPVGRAAPP